MARNNRGSQGNPYASSYTPEDNSPIEVPNGLGGWTRKRSRSDSSSGGLFEFEEDSAEQKFDFDSSPVQSAVPADESPFNNDDEGHFSEAQPKPKHARRPSAPVGEGTYQAPEYQQGHVRPSSTQQAEPRPNRAPRPTHNQPQPDYNYGQPNGPQPNYNPNQNNNAGKGIIGCTIFFVFAVFAFVIGTMFAIFDDSFFFDDIESELSGLISDSESEDGEGSEYSSDSYMPPDEMCTMFDGIENSATTVDCGENYAYIISTVPVNDHCIASVTLLVDPDYDEATVVTYGIDWDNSDQSMTDDEFLQFRNDSIDEAISVLQSMQNCMVEYEYDYFYDGDLVESSLGPTGAARSSILSDLSGDYHAENNSSFWVNTAEDVSHSDDGISYTYTIQS